MTNLTRTDDVRLWAVVAATVRPLPGRGAPAMAASVERSGSAAPPAKALLATARPTAHPGQVVEPKKSRSLAERIEPIEPNRRRRIDLGRESLAASLDLHGLGRESARERLIAFVARKQSENARAILVITGKGLRGDGVLRRLVPEWLAEPPLRDLVAGLSEAHPKKGGAGALYVVLRRRPR